MSESSERPGAAAGEAAFRERFGPASDAEKREALVELRDRYVEARGDGASGEKHSNLDWILGARRNPTQDPLGFETKTIELIALWLQDLAVELDRRLTTPPRAEAGDGALAALEARKSVARELRDATERFLVAFRSPLNPS
jgi:hypothetical protein